MSSSMAGELSSDPDNQSHHIGSTCKNKLPCQSLFKRPIGILNRREELFLSLSNSTTETETETETENENENETEMTRNPKLDSLGSRAWRLANERRCQPEEANPLAELRPSTPPKQSIDSSQSIRLALKRGANSRRAQFESHRRNYRLAGSSGSLVHLLLKVTCLLSALSLSFSISLSLSSNLAASELIGLENSSTRDNNEISSGTHLLPTQGELQTGGVNLQSGNGQYNAQVQPSNQPTGLDDLFTKLKQAFGRAPSLDGDPSLVSNEIATSPHQQVTAVNSAPVSTTKVNGTLSSLRKVNESSVISAVTSPSADASLSDSNLNLQSSTSETGANETITTTTVTALTTLILPSETVNKLENTQPSNHSSVPKLISDTQNNISSTTSTATSTSVKVESPDLSSARPETERTTKITETTEISTAAKTSTSTTTSTTSSQQEPVTETTTIPSSNGGERNYLGGSASSSDDETSASTENDSSSRGDADDAEACEGLSVHQPAKAANDTENARLVHLQSCLQAKVRRNILKASRSGMEILEKLSLSGGCSWSLMNLMSGLGNLKSYAFKFFDASSKLPSGVLYGLLSDFGDFDQCISIRSSPNVGPEDEVENSAYSGKYCLLSMRPKYRAVLGPNLTVPEGIIPDGLLWDDLLKHYWTSNSTKGFQFGWCFPSRCTNDDLDQLYRHIAEMNNFEGQILSCQSSLDVKQQYQPDFLQRIIICAFVLLVLLSITGTLTERYLITPAQSFRESATNQDSGPSLGHSNNSVRFKDTIVTPDTNQSERDEDRNYPKTKLIREISYGLLFILNCFSVPRNWRKFLHKDNCRLINYTYRSNVNSATISTLVSSNIDEIATIYDENSSPLRVLEQIGVANSNSLYSIPKMTTNNEKFGELTIRVQPDDQVDSSSIQSRAINPLGHLSGLKLLIIIWITIGYSFLYPSANNYQHYRSIINLSITRNSIWFATTNFTLGIDMLLYVTGLVFVYKLAHRFSVHQQSSGTESQRISLESGWSCTKNILCFVLELMAKFWPSYLSLIGLAIVLPLLSDGPMWPEMVSHRLAESCRSNWWLNLLFINNFLKESEICLPSSWFISLIAQLFFLGSLIVVVARKICMQAAIGVLFIILVISCAISFAFAYHAEIRAPVIRMDESFVMEMDAEIFRLYTNLFNNLGPFLIGMAGGFLLIRAQIKERSSLGSRAGSLNQSIESSIRSNNRKKQTARGRSRILNWILDIINAGLVLAIAILVLSSVFYQTYSRLGSAIYWSLHRVGWSIVTGYLIHKCATGQWKFLGDLLSVSAFVPISKLMFLAYLIYPMLTLVHTGLVRDGLHVSVYNMLSIYISRLAMTFALALFIHITISLPINSISDFYFGKWMRKMAHSSSSNPSQHETSKTHPLLKVAPSDSIHNLRRTKSGDSQVTCDETRACLSEETNEPVGEKRDLQS